MIGTMFGNICLCICVIADLAFYFALCILFLMFIQQIQVLLISVVLIFLAVRLLSYFFHMVWKVIFNR